jgi:asparagine synthase (glutamine-hydrolysing)
VLLRLYLQHGIEGMLARINGMFAIVIVDLRERTLTLVRDGTGIKPMLWAKAGNAVVFGSEIKSFLAHPQFDPQLSDANLDEYLAFRYCAGDRHLLKGVRSLRPGHFIRFAPSTEPTEHRFYSIPDCIEPTAGFGEAALLDALETRLKASVTSQLLADVKVGCQLSGGIDSSLTTLYANKQRTNSIEAFSIVLDDARLSEEAWIDEAARVAGVKGHRFQFDNDDFFENLVSATWHLEQPINHPNTLGIKRLAEQSRPAVKVLLSGEGADELMGGYNRFYYARIRPKLGPLLEYLAHAPGIGERWMRNLRPDLKDDIDYFIAASMHMQPAQLAAIRPETDLTATFYQRREIFEEGRGSHLSRCMKYEMQTHMVDLLLRQDRMTMAHSIEGRVPFLDRDLIAFVRALPDEVLVGQRLSLRDQRSRMTKMLLKQLARRNFSEAFVYRAKSGFTLPLLAYYRDSRFTTFMEDVILPGMKRRGLFESEPLRRWWSAIESMPRTLDETFWIPVMFELWAQQWIDGRNSARGGDASEVGHLALPSVEHVQNA